MIWFLLSAFLCLPVFASDLMNLNELMPTRIEDAAPIDAKQWQMQLSTAFNEDGDSDQAFFWPNLRYGVNKRLQLEAYHTLKSGGDETGNGDIYIGGLYQLNESHDWSPVFAFEPNLTLSTGEHSRGEDFDYKILISSSLRGTPQKPITQFHFNFKQSYNDDPRSNERRNRYMYAVGMSQRVNHLTVFVADLIFSEEKRKWHTDNAFEVGLLRMVEDDVRIGVGLGVGIGEDSPSWGANLALVKLF